MNMNTAARFFGAALVLTIATYVVPGFEVADPFTAVVVAVAISWILLILQPARLWGEYPPTPVMVGVPAFIVSGLLLWITSTYLPGYTVHGFGILIAALAVAVVLFIVENHF